MPTIQQLSPHVADLIAAGEVVERPASVVKELVENAIDAGASSVTVEIMGGGMHYIRITDNGCGIPAEDAPTAFLRHATSKIRTEYDLEAIGTLGFRGEALAAISAVSRVELMTRTAEADFGTSLLLEGGEVRSQEDTGCPQGTTMIVRDLFFNTPARLKFMKRDSAEGAAVFTVVQHEALCHPELSFRFIREGKEELLTPGDGKLASALYAVLGREAAMGFLECPASGEDIRVEGYCSRPACCRGTRAMQFFFVNGRYVKSRTMTAAVEQAYANTKMVGKFPACVLSLTCKLNRVDVNVHPAKTEVKFTDDHALFDAVYYAVKSALEREQGHVQAVLEDKRPRPQRSDTVTPNQTFFKSMTAEQYRADGPLLRSTAVSAYQSKITPWQAATSRNAAQLLQRQQEQQRQRQERQQSWQQQRQQQQKKQEQDVRAVMEALELQSAGKVLPAEEPPLPRELRWAAEPDREASLPAEDRQEASAPERESAPAPLPETETAPVTAPVPDLPDDLTTAAESPVTPETPAWRLAGEVLNTYIIVEQGDTVTLIDKHAAHERMNFDRMKAQGYQPMSQILLTPVVMRADPAECEALLDHLPLLEQFGFETEDFGGGDLLIRQVPDYIAPEEAPQVLSELAQKLLSTGSADPDSARDDLLHTMACKAAIKGGWKNDPAELEAVAAAVMSGQVRYCPHGRPVAIELTRKTLEKQFGRIQ